MKTTIAIDGMGGDHGPVATVAGSLSALERHPGLELIITGNEQELRAALARSRGKAKHRCFVRPATQVVEMHELPSQALRKKKDSSMRVALDLLKDGSASACVSAGNTGALMAMARFVLKTLPGIDRPAICNAMPGVYGSPHVLDLGANVNSSPEQLFQFAVMGSVLTTAVATKERPSVALLNIGEEEIKGNDGVKRAARLLINSDLNYVGYCEANDIYEGNFDVIVCDGFVGNVALKASEGAAKLLAHYAREAFSRSLYTKLVALISNPILSGLKRRTDPRRYNGASLLGLRGIVIKSHGSADQLSFMYAIEEAIKEVEKDVPTKISEHLEKILVKKEAV